MTRAILILTALLALAVPATAAAEVRSGSVSDPADMYRPNTDLSACQNPDVERVEATYSTNGVFRVTFRFYSPITGTECGDNNGIEASADLEGPSTPYALIKINEWQAEDLTAKLDLQGVYGSFTGVAEYGSDSRSLIATFSDSGLASRNYRSVRTSTRNYWTTDMSEDGQQDNVDMFYFAGYEPAVDPGPPSPPPADDGDYYSPTPSAPTAPRVPAPTCSDSPTSALPWCNRPLTDAQRASRQPTYVTVSSFGSTDVYLKAKPKRFAFWGSALAFSVRFTNIRWSSWTRNRAIGKGYSKALHGRLSKSGRLVFDRYKVRIVLSRKRLCGDTYEFTRARITNRWGRYTLKVPHAC